MLCFSPEIKCHVTALNVHQKKAIKRVAGQCVAWIVCELTALHGLKKHAARCFAGNMYKVVRNWRYASLCSFHSKFPPHDVHSNMLL